MKIIEPSATIIEDELANLSIYQRIAYCAGVCYQREPRKTEEEAQEFCKKMVKIGHMSTLEMAVVHLVVPAWSIPDHKFLSVSQLEGDRFVISGSIRAFIEVDKASDLLMFLRSELPLFFGVGDTNPNPKYEPTRLAQPHEIPWQHKHVAVRFIVNRAVSHELVRHRPMSFLQESQRYCRYEDEVTFIEPEWFRQGIRQAELDWGSHMSSCENRYREFLQQGLKPQQARAVLPNSTKTELIAYASLPQWKHIFKLRCSPAADPEMRKIMIPLEQEFKVKYPEAFNE